ncbi:MAG: bifunctional diaminohydroxyphosphoribosylaminopyrimidine deaminase/5-amino-6-(5-phosphoribosylamino)uracil reductase RibD [Candidatus Aminicenantales bacterium]
MISAQDLSYMEMAYGLAARARGWASPNPLVGAVIVNRNRIVGTGYHAKPGKPHAEILALEKAGEQARGAKAYITLEPCVHWGRTPPCVDRLIAAGLRSVVISSVDVNPLVYRKGIQKLREAGIRVSVGLMEEKHKKMNEAYETYIRDGIPFVTAKVAVSLDGKMATRERKSRWITSRRAREYVHLLRGEHDALMVGIHTILKDDPFLTVRHPLWRRKRLVRIVLDTKLRILPEARILKTLNRGRLIVFTHEPSSSRKAEALQKAGAEIVSLPEGSSPRVDLKKVLSWLGHQGISSVLVEGGSRLLTSLLEAGLVHKVFLVFAPKLVGGEKALPFYLGKGARTPAEALELKKRRVYSLGEDWVVEGYL